MPSDPRDVLTRSAPAPDQVLAYRDGSAHVLDLHLPPAGEGPAPLVVLLHGGFWRDAFDRTHTRSLADALRREGYAVATPEYRRTPGARWPQLRDDIVAVRDALPDLLKRATDPERIDHGPYRLLGHSAGGHLALWWGLSVPHRVERVVALAPVADLARAYADHLDDGAVAALLGGGPADAPEAYAEADIAPRLPAAQPPIVVLHGDRDERVPLSHSLGLGIPVRELAGVEHFGPIDPSSPAWPAVRDALR